jgi:SAM-dependent methyltransferase
MHPTAMDFVTRTLTAEHVTGKLVLEVGSYDVNGSVRPHVESLGPARYLGVDASTGPRVDMVVDCEHLATEVGYAAWDLVITTEMLEHVRDWRACMFQLASVVKPGGFLLITTRSPGFPYHPFPEDHWRYTNDQMRAILTALGLEILTLDDDPDPGVFALAQRTDISGLVGAGFRLQDLTVEDVIR